MRTLIILLCGLAVPTLAQNYNSAIKQAHNAVNQTESASQGSTRPTQPSQPPAAQSPSDPMLAATLKNIANLRGDFDAMAGGFAPKSLTNDLASAAIAIKVSASLVAKLAGDLQTAIGGNQKLNPQHQKLAQDIHAIFNSAHLSSVQQETVEKDVQKILKDGGVSDDQIEVVVSDMKAVANETK